MLRPVTHDHVGPIGLHGDAGHAVEDAAEAVVAGEVERASAHAVGHVAHQHGPVHAAVGLGARLAHAAQPLVAALRVDDAPLVRPGRAAARGLAKAAAQQAALLARRHEPDHRLVRQDGAGVHAPQVDAGLADVDQRAPALSVEVVAQQRALHELRERIELSELVGGLR